MNYLFYIYFKGITFFFLFVFFFTHQYILANEKSKSIFPHYKIDVSYAHDKTLLTAKMQVSFNKKEYPDNELLFALPGNRFLYPDHRGIRKHKIIPVFSIRRFRESNEDPKSPKGFSFGEMEIQSVSIINNSTNKRIMLDYNLEHNFELEIGYSTNNGILRIFLPEDFSEKQDSSSKNVLEIDFSTKFPDHLDDGLSNGMLITSNWYPKLLNWQKNKILTQSTSLNLKSILYPATFEVNFKAINSGMLISTSGSHNFLQGQVRRLPKIERPLKSFPLIFIKNKKKILFKKEEDFFLESVFAKGIRAHKIISFYFEDQKRKGKLILDWTKSFFKFIQSSYGMTLPWEKIIIIPVDAEYEQVEVINNLILVPFPNYKRSELMDRQVIGFLTRSLGELWFGESVWNNQENQLWLNLGIPSFLGLRYFQYQFGKNEGIFESIDWLNPRYKDHYYENMVNNIAPRMKYPIISSFEKTPDSQSFLKALTYKTALVISMLEYLIGNRVFKKGLQHFSKEYNQKVVGLKEFQLSFEKYNSLALRSGTIKGLRHYNVFENGSLEWFFQQWFHTKKSLDYSLQGFSTRKLSNGFFETEVNVKKIGLAQMPFEVSIKTKNGNEYRKILEGINNDEKVFFLTKSLPEKVSIDPDEKLMETSRINNHSFSYYRVRFAFDWKKDREHLVLIVPGLGNNAIDGNSLGLGVHYAFENYRIFAIPGYGTKNKRLLYIFNLDRKNFGLHGFEAGFSFYEFGGVKSQGLRAKFEPSQNPGEFGYKFQTSFSYEKLFASGENMGENSFSETGESNSLLFEYTGNFSPSDYYEVTWNLWNEQPALSFPSDYVYVRGQGTLNQIFRVGHRKSIEIDIIRSSTAGDSPMQKKFQLGGPNVLRGFPQKIALSDDHLLASRFGFKFPLIHSSFWGVISTFKIQGSIFFDQGKIWSDRISFDDTSYRKNAGIGVEWTLDTVSLFQIPLKIEVAYPLDDDDYKKPQFIFLGVLTGS